MSSAIPPSFECPILHDVMINPVTTADGHSYERSAIVRWLRERNTSPATGAVLPHKELTPNVTLHKAIEEWEEKYFSLINCADLEVETQTIATGAFKRVSRGKLKRAPGTTALLTKPRAVAVLEMCDGAALVTEAKILVRLARHPRLVRYVGMCKDFREDGRTCLVTELAALGSLSDAMEGIADELTTGHECAILQQVCSGMEMLASEGLVHRDLALRNVLLFVFDKGDVDVTSVKVADFGLTVSMYGGSHRTVATGPRPIRCMAPEALRRDRFSEKSDVWAYGVMAFELLSRGDVPYMKVCPADKEVYAYVVDAKKTLTRPQDDDLLCVHDAYDDMWALLQSCWNYRVQDRPTFAQMSVALGRLPLPDTTVARSGQGHHGASATASAAVASDASTVDADMFVLKSTGQVVSMNWLFHNGYKHSDCDKLSDRVMEAHEVLQQNKAATIIDMQTTQQTIDAILAVSTKLHDNYTSVQAQIDGAMDVLVQELTERTARSAARQLGKGSCHP